MLVVVEVQKATTSNKDRKIVSHSLPTETNRSFDNRFWRGDDYERPSWC